ncbi:hypothetical protein E2C01_001930 [Portunus trituberculatus]|uniref:Uncharacterized protein n=1 Tax=Portunus trituberculatus TaxID=210409 RepID=A0A5B7CNY8_PORTR|nr:hypothetical protein [Portunus trituberculatus]
MTFKRPPSASEFPSGLRTIKSMSPDRCPPSGIVLNDRPNSVLFNGSKSQFPIYHLDTTFQTTSPSSVTLNYPLFYTKHDRFDNHAFLRGTNQTETQKPL